MKEEFCVYFHINHIKQEVFYVGIGDLKRPYHKAWSRSKFWRNEVRKYGYDIIVIHEGLNWKEACELEVQYIKQIGRRDLGLGSLVNHTDGGEGFRGHSEETRLKMRLAKLGKTLSQETKLKMSKASKGIKKSEEAKKNMSVAQKGKKLSEETKKKVGLSSKGRNVGRVVSEETKLKLILAYKNRKPRTQEEVVKTKLKMKESRLRFLKQNER